MALKDLLGIDRSVKPLTREEGMRILERDRYRCQYCGLDGLAHFENSLIMTVDFVVPRKRQGTKEEVNLLTACRPCNVLKGNRKFNDVEEAKTYVLQKRAQLRREWDEKAARFRTNSATEARG